MRARLVTGERIRDKIAASKKKGIWMGGTVPLGYDWCERRLVVNPAEAATVRLIFERYLKLGSVRLLKEKLTRDGIVSKVRLSKKSNQSGGQPFGRGALYELLANPIYLGEIRHRKVRYPGQQQAIVDKAVWQQVQERLRKQAAHHRRLDAKGVSSPLAGKLFDENGEPLYACGANKGRAPLSLLRLAQSSSGFGREDEEWVAFAGTRDRAGSRKREPPDARRSASNRREPAGSWRADRRSAAGARSSQGEKRTARAQKLGSRQ